MILILKKKVFARVIEAGAALRVSWPGRGSLPAPEEKRRGFEAHIKKTWLNKNADDNPFSTERCPAIPVATGREFKGSGGRSALPKSPPYKKSGFFLKLQALDRVPVPANIHRITTTRTNTKHLEREKWFIFDLNRKR